MTINFYLNVRSKKQKQSPILVYIRGVGKKKTIVLHSGEYLNQKYWDKNRQRPRKNYHESIELNKYLSKVETELRQCYRKLVAGTKEISFENVKENLKKHLENILSKDGSTEFFAVFDEFITSREEQKISERTLAKFRTLKNHLKEFQKSKKYPLSFSAVNQKFYDKYLAFSRQQLLHTENTIGKYIKTLKTFLYWSRKCGYHQNIDFEDFKAPEEETDIVFLSEDELLRLFYLDLSTNKRLEKVRDTFVFACVTGPRFSDVSKLTHSDIRGTTWYFRPVKSRDPLPIPLNDYALRILAKYKDSDKPLPIISEQRMNDYIKELGKLAGIDDITTTVRYRGSERIEKTDNKFNFLSTHTARRTFVTLSLMKKAQPEWIMSVTGHKDVRTMRKYLKIVTTYKEEQMQKIWQMKPNPETVKTLDHTNGQSVTA